MRQVTKRGPAARAGGPCQLPLTLAMTAVVLAAPGAGRPLRDGPCRTALALLGAPHGLPPVALAAVRAAAPLAIPVLDLAAICLLRSGSVEGLSTASIGILAVASGPLDQRPRRLGPRSGHRSRPGRIRTPLPLTRPHPAGRRPASPSRLPRALRRGPGQPRGVDRARPLQDDAGASAARRAHNEVTGLVDALAAKDDVVSTVSHEFRTPLTSIIGNLDLVLGDSDGLSTATVVAASRWRNATPSGCWPSSRTC